MGGQIEWEGEAPAEPVRQEPHPSGKDRSNYYRRSGSCQRSFQHRIFDKIHYIKLDT